MGSLLVIAYHYPPKGNVRSIGNAKFIKYLDRLGWDIHVLTSTLQKNEDKDSSLLKSVPPNLQITHIDGYSRYIRKMELKSRFPPLWWWMPDREFLWINNSIRTGSKIIKKGNIDIIYVFSPPYSATIIGLWLSRIHNKPLVIDFRDPWTQNFYLPKYPTIFHNWINNFIEHFVSSKGTALIFNSPSLKRIFLEKHKDISGEKCYIVTNGYDPEDFIELSYEKPSKFTMSAVGSLYGAEPLLRNLSYLINSNKIIKSDVCLQMTKPQYSDTMNYVTKYKVEEITNLLERLTYLKSLELMANSHVLLLTLPKNVQHVECVPTSKIYHYMATGNPILTIAPMGEAIKITQNYKNGFTVDPSDNQGIQDAIIELYSRYRHNEFIQIDTNNNLQNYSYEKLALKLSQIFQHCVST